MYACGPDVYGRSEDLARALKYLLHTGYYGELQHHGQCPHFCRLDPSLKKSTTMSTQSASALALRTKLATC